MKDYKALQNGSDIRGVAIEAKGGKPVNLTDEAVADLTAGFAEWLCEKTGKPFGKMTVAIGRDSRLSGEHILEIAANTLANAGFVVLDCGLATTPAMFMSTVFAGTSADGSIMITASHLPFERNGLKFFTRDGGLDKPDIKKIIEIAEKSKGLKASGRGRILIANLMDLYATHLRTLIVKGLGMENETCTGCGGCKPLEGLHVVVDAGNGAGGFYVRDVLEPLGADCSGSQFLEPDGTFPNHQPNPENEAAMESICGAVKASEADLGIIFDTDGDRSAAVDENGFEISRNRIVALAAVLAAEGHPETTVVTDSITSTQLGKFLTEELKVKHLRFKRGYKNVINKGLELNAAGTDCQLAIETSGHAAMKENYFLDDGAYLATRIVVKAALLKREEKGISTLIESMQDPKEAKEFRFAITAADFAPYAQNVLDRIESAVKNGELPGTCIELPNYEGVRINFDEDHGAGWLLIRKSLHDPVMPMNVESDEKGGVEKIFAQIKILLSEFKELAL